MYKTKIKNKNKSKGFLRTINTAILITLISAVVIQVIIANFAANQRYEIAKYLEDQKFLQKETDTLTSRVASLRSMEHLDKQSALRALVKADTIYYIASKSPVALRK